MSCNFSCTYSASGLSPHIINYSELIVSGTCENDFLVVDTRTAEEIITLVQVDQALCDEAEAGRIHGNGVLSQGCWECGTIRLNLHHPLYSCECDMLLPDGDSVSPSGQPYIEKAECGGYASCLNKTWKLNTNFIYLRMATGILSDTYPPISMGGFKHGTIKCESFTEKIWFERQLGR